MRLWCTTGPASLNSSAIIRLRMIDVMNHGYNDQYGCQSQAWSLQCVWAPRQISTFLNGHVIPGLINKAVQAKADGTPFEIWGLGHRFVSSFYSLIWLNCSSGFREYEEIDPIILASDTEVSIKDVAYMILEAAEFKGEVKFWQTRLTVSLRNREQREAPWLPARVQVLRR